MKIQLLVEFEVEDDIAKTTAERIESVRSAVLYAIEEQLECTGFTGDSNFDDQITGVEVTVVG